MVTNIVNPAVKFYFLEQREQQLSTNLCKKKKLNSPDFKNKWERKLEFQGKQYFFATKSKLKIDLKKNYFKRLFIKIIFFSSASV